MFFFFFYIIKSNLIGSIYKTEIKLEQFYSCLIKSSLEREDVANLEQENLKNSFELQQTFRNSVSCYKSYLYKTFAEILTGICLILFYGAFARIDGIENSLFDCDVHGIEFRCVIPNRKFFWVIELF